MLQIQIIAGGGGGEAEKEECSCHIYQKFEQISFSLLIVACTCYMQLHHSKFHSFRIEKYIFQALVSVLHLKLIMNAGVHISE